jgi:hypothetical protein
MPTMPFASHGFSPQENIGILIEAINERILAAKSLKRHGSGAPALPEVFPAGIQNLNTLFPALQSALESLSAYYRDDQNEYTSIGGGVRYDFYTVVRWREAAGLNVLGYRRADTWGSPATPPVFSYGAIQHGDILGYWIWDDIVRGLRALTHSQIAPANRDMKDVQTRGFAGLTLTNVTEAQCRAEISDAWANTSWNAITDEWRPHRCWGNLQFNGESGIGDMYHGEYNAWRGKPGVLFDHAPPVGGTVTAWKRARAAFDTNCANTYDIEGLSPCVHYDWDEYSFNANDMSAYGTAYNILSTRDLGATVPLSTIATVMVIEWGNQEIEWDFKWT